MLGGLPANFPGAATASSLLAAGRRDSTWSSYTGKLQRFIDFCQRVVPQCGLPPVRALPARADYVAAYIGYLREEGLVHANSLQPYLSCINQWHADMGLEKPAVGHLIQRLRRGFCKAEGQDAEGELVASRRPIPAHIMLQVLHLARNARHDQSQRGRLLRRAATASVLAFAFMLRGDSLVQLRRQDITASADGLVLRIRVKTRGRTVATTVHRPGCDEVYDVIRAWLDDFLAPNSALVWTIDDSDSASFPSSCLGKWFQEACDFLQLSPPVGELWSGHSHRSGGATAALSIDASLPAIARFGVWDNMASVQPYLDPSVGPTPSALLFFDHLLKPSLAQVRTDLQQMRADSSYCDALLAV